MLILFSIIVIGAAIGRLTIGGFGLKNSGVLLVAMVFGHYGYSIPLGIGELGLLLFVYAVGLQAGSKFFRCFGAQPKVYIIISLVPILVAASFIFLLSRYTEYSSLLLLGMFSGALTSTPALAAVIDYFSGSSNSNTHLITLGYSIAYPFGMLGAALFVQMMPFFFRRSLVAEGALEEGRYNKELSVKHFKVTNQNCFGVSLRELDTRRLAAANISRITRANQIIPTQPELILEADDIVTMVCDEKKISALSLLFGEEVTDAPDIGQDLLAVDLELSLAELTEKSLSQLNFVATYGVNITRVKRQGVEFAPTADTMLEFADIIRVVGRRQAVDEFARLLGKDRAVMQQTNMLPFITGILLGVIFGAFPFYLTESINFKLGVSGGCFLVALVLGHYGKIGAYKVYVPIAAINLCRELGIVLFLASSGIGAGANFINTLEAVGYGTIAFAAFVTMAYIIVAFILAYYLFHKKLLHSLGTVCGVANNSLPLNHLKEVSKSDHAALAYATIYPLTLIFKIIAAQLLIQVLINN